MWLRPFRSSDGGLVVSQIILFLGGVVLLLTSLWFVDWRLATGTLGVLVAVFAMYVDSVDE
jgi:hypothetical protein